MLGIGGRDEVRHGLERLDRIPHRNADSRVAKKLEVVLSIADAGDFFGQDPQRLGHGIQAGGLAYARRTNLQVAVERGGRVNGAVQKSLDSGLGRFYAGDIAGGVEFDDFVEVVVLGCWPDDEAEVCGNFHDKRHKPKLWKAAQTASNGLQRNCALNQGPLPADIPKNGPVAGHERGAPRDRPA